jgi:hypothetical protein
MALEPWARNRNGNPNDDFPTEQAQVTWNALLDKSEITRKMQNKGSALYPPNSEITDFSVKVRDLTWRYREGVGLSSEGQRRGEIMVASTLNGCFKKGDNLMQIYNLIQFAGVAKTDCDYDPRSPQNLPKIGVALATHGSHQIYNTGPHRFEQGDWIMWSLPDPEDPIRSTMQGQEGRITLLTTPYRPRDPSWEGHALLAENLHHFIDKRKVKINKDQSDKNIVSEGALMLRRGIMEAGLVLVHALCSSGILTVNRDFLVEDSIDPADHEARLADYEGLKLEFLQKLHDTLHIMDTKKTFTVNHGENEYDLDVLVDKYIFSRNDPEFQIYDDHLVKSDDFHLKKDIIQSQESAIEDLIRASPYVNHHFTGRIFAQSMQTANAKEKVLVMLQNGTITPL